MFIIDFDDTLFDTQGFKMARVKVLEEIGISEEIYWKTYKEARNNNDGEFTYSDKRHAEVCGLYGYDAEQVYQQLKKVTDNVKEYLFDDTMEFLLEIKKCNEPMILLSLGDPSYQELKVRGSGIHKMFDRMFMVEASKDKVIEEVISFSQPSHIWFINDKVQETINLKNKFKILKPVLIVSPIIPIEEYENSKLPYFNHLPEVLEYVRSTKQ